MKRKTVRSSNIASIGHNAESQILEVEFNDGSIYHYNNVSSSIYNRLMGATSHGSFLNANVKGKFNYRRIN